MTISKRQQYMPRETMVYFQNTSSIYVCMQCQWEQDMELKETPDVNAEAMNYSPKLCFFFLG